jgi:hypothetical protein
MLAASCALMALGGLVALVIGLSALPALASTYILLTALQGGYLVGLAATYLRVTRVSAALRLPHQWLWRGAGGR